MGADAPTDPQRVYLHPRVDSATASCNHRPVSLVIMPLLSWAQRRTGRELGSGSVVADSKQTLLCTYLSAVVLVGLLANSLLGWWWADPLAALVVAGVALRESLEAWRGEACGCGPVTGSACTD